MSLNDSEIMYTSGNAVMKTKNARLTHRNDRQRARLDDVPVHAAVLPSGRTT